jgi:hypothetical protein
MKGMPIVTVVTLATVLSAGMPGMPRGTLGIFPATARSPTFSECFSKDVRRFVTNIERYSTGSVAERNWTATRDAYR